MATSAASRAAARRYAHTPLGRAARARAAAKYAKTPAGKEARRRARGAYLARQNARRPDLIWGRRWTLADLGAAPPAPAGETRK